MGLRGWRAKLQPFTYSGYIIVLLHSFRMTNYQYFDRVSVQLSICFHPWHFFCTDLYFCFFRFDIGVKNTRNIIVIFPRCIKNNMSGVNDSNFFSDHLQLTNTAFFCVPRGTVLSGGIVAFYNIRKGNVFDIIISIDGICNGSGITPIGPRFFPQMIPGLPKSKLKITIGFTRISTCIFANKQNTLFVAVKLVSYNPCTHRPCQSVVVILALSTNWILLGQSVFVELQKFFLAIIDIGLK